MHRILFVVSAENGCKHDEEIHKIKSEKRKKWMTVDNICNRIYIIRGQQVMLDYDLATEQAYHCGAKDAGKKLCAINVILETSRIHPAIDKLLSDMDKQI